MSARARRLVGAIVGVIGGLVVHGMLVTGCTLSPHGSPNGFPDELPNGLPDGSRGPRPDATIHSSPAMGSALPAETDCVLLLHGLARTTRSMEPMRKALATRGYLTVNQGYPSRKHTIATLAALAVPTGLSRCRALGASRVHVVTHSLGGILLRAWLERQREGDLGRVVMLAPPNQGSEVVDDWARVPGYRLLFGTAGLELGTDGVPATLGPMTVETAVIAGTRSINLILSLSLPNPDDGKVSVAATRVAGMCAHLSVPVSHPFIMRDRRVIAETLSWLGEGRLRSTRALASDCGFDGPHVGEPAEDATVDALGRTFGLSNTGPRRSA